MKMMCVALALVAMAASLSGCNTVRGVGTDITSGAETVQGWMN